MKHCYYAALAAFSINCDLTAAYKRPASAYFVDPRPEEYRYWKPDPQRHGHFHSKNPWKHPWQPYQYPPPHYPPHPQCEANHPCPQEKYWLPNFAGVHEGTSPFLANGSNYQVFRNVKDFGAIGDGFTDDTAAINKAITCIAAFRAPKLPNADCCVDGGRVSGGQGAGGTTGQPALIYIPPGVYLISSKIQMFVDTQMIGGRLRSLPHLLVQCVQSLTIFEMPLNFLRSKQPQMLRTGQSY